MHFVQGVDRDPIKLQFLKSIQSIAKSCGTRVIAEGVETEAELKTVKNLGIAFGQGYFIARPSHTPPLLADLATSRVINATKITLFPQYASNAQAQITAQTLLTYVEAVSPETNNAQIFARFSADSALRVIPIVKGGRPLGLLNRHRFMTCYSNAQKNDSWGTLSCQHLLMTEPLLVDKSMPIEELSQFLVEAEGHHLDDGFIITEQGRYLGIASGQNLLRELTRMHQEAARYADPLTLLPGNVPIQKHIESLLRAHIPFVACHCDLNHFKPFNQVYGYDKGDEMIQLNGRVLSSVCDAKNDFIGHLGGDHFVLLMQSHDWKSRCERALNHFTQTAQVMFDAAHIHAGGYHQLSRTGELQFYPITRLSIGAVAVIAGQYMSHHEVSAAMHVAKSQAKRLSGNGLFIEQRSKST
jgi:diguanylate cyclase (GGDEF)-like protein